MLCKLSDAFSYTSTYIISVFIFLKSCLVHQGIENICRTQNKVQKKSLKLGKVSSLIFLFKPHDTLDSQFVKLHSVRDSYQFLKHPTDFKHSDTIQTLVCTWQLILMKKTVYHWSAGWRMQVLRK